MIGFINDVMEEGRLRTSKVVTTGNIVIDSLVEYWKRTAEKEEIEFQAELSIPMEMSFKRGRHKPYIGKSVGKCGRRSRKS